MSDALAPPFLVASLVLCVAGLLKLRSPDVAAAALRTRPWTIRALAAGEVALGAACVLHPTRATAAVLTGAYATLAGGAAALRRGRAACGCFGDDDLPVSLAHVIASGLLGAVAVATAVASPRGLPWLASQPAPVAGVVAAGIAGAAYATVLVYTLAPRAWAAWSGG
jgi:hypothetical protein